MLEMMFRQELTAQAINTLQDRKEKEKRRNESSELLRSDAPTPIEEEAGTGVWVRRTASSPEVRIEGV